MRRLRDQRVRELRQLARIAKVDDGADAICDERGDTRRGELVEVVGAHDMTPGCLSSGCRSKTAEIARVEKVRPNEVSIHGSSAARLMREPRSIRAETGERTVLLCPPNGRKLEWPIQHRHPP